MITTNRRSGPPIPWNQFCESLPTPVDPETWSFPFSLVIPHYPIDGDGAVVAGGRDGGWFALAVQFESSQSGEPGKSPVQHMTMSGHRAH
jgi:hypothetical protein